MYAPSMGTKIEWPSRMSLPLTREEKNLLIDLKADLQKEERTLKDFVWEAVMEKWHREKAKKK